MEKENFTTVSFEELWSELSGSTKFGQDELIEMISLQDDDDKDFYIYHRHKAFRVPLEKIREFFTRHTKPVPPMTKDQELKYLREKVQKLQDEAEGFKAGEKIARPAPDVPDEPEEDTKVVGESPISADDLGSKVVDGVEKGELKVIPPKRDESIPPLQDRKKESVKEVRARLAKELKEDKVNPAKQKLMDSAVPKDIPRE